MKFFIGTAGAAQTFLETGAEVINIKSFGDGKLLVLYKGGPTIAGEVREVIKEVEVIKEIEVEKIVQVDNPAHLEKVKVLESELAQCQESCVEKDARLKKLGVEIQKLKKAVAAYTAE